METGELCRKHGISQQTFYRWKAKYGGLDLARRRRPLILREAEDAKFQTAMDCIMARIRFFGKTI